MTRHDLLLSAAKEIAATQDTIAPLTGSVEASSKTTAPAPAAPVWTEEMLKEVAKDAAVIHSKIAQPLAASD